MEIVIPERLFEGRAAAVCFASALATAFVFPMAAGPGIGLFLGGLTIGAAFLIAREELRTEELSFGLAGLAMLALTSIRAAEWLAALLIFGALVTSTVAAAGGPRWRDVFAAPLRLLLTVEYMPRFFSSPFQNLSSWGPRWGPALRAGVLAAMLVVVFGGIFASADEAFAVVTGELFGILQLDFEFLPARFFIFLAATVACAALVLGVMKKPLQVDGPEDTTRRPQRSGFEWKVGVAALNFVFAAFVTVQFAVLFGGRTHLLETAGLTYAEYARSGFFQLVIVALLTLAVIAAAVWFSPSITTGDRMTLRVLLGVLCLLTVVILISAHFRLSLYEDAFGFTRARLFGHAFIVLLAAIFGAIMLAGLLWRAHWLPRATFYIAALFLLIFATADPDRLIASQNLQRFEEAGQIDLWYLRSLSPDAVPVLMDLPDPLRSCVLERMRHSLRREEGWNDWNFSRQRARGLLGSESLGAEIQDCAQILSDDFRSGDAYP